jgi:hypothetical protein
MAPAGAPRASSDARGDHEESTVAIPDLIVDDNGCGNVSLPLNPFVSNRYHFGMLLGVADLDTEQGYHRAKTWLHTAWLHGEGAVWGLRVEVRAEAGEVVVNPGLATDRNGRELSLAEPQCLDIGRWFDERRPDDLAVVDDGAGGVLFRIHVTLCADQCLDRPVPSISEPCEGSDLGTAYSRTVERAVPALVGGPAPEPPPGPYLRLRQFVGQLRAEDETVAEALAAVEAAAPGDRPAVCLVWFRRLAALDTMDIAPDEGVGGLFPAAGPGCIVLAELVVHLRRDGEAWVVVDDGATPTAVDNGVRPAHVRTRTIQELLGCAAGIGAPPPDTRSVRSARGRAARRAETAGPPRAVAGSARLRGSSLRFRVTAPLDPATVTKAAFAVTTLRASGWATSKIDQAQLDDAGTTVTLRLASAPRSRPARVVARGAGPAPLVGTDGRPLSGADVDGRTVSSGEDAALMVGASPSGDPGDRNDHHSTE